MQDAKNRHLGTVAHLCQYGSLLVAEIVSLDWGTPANFDGFRVYCSDVA